MTEPYENVPNTPIEPTGPQLRMVLTVHQHQPRHEAEKRRVMRGVNRIFYILIWGALVFFAVAGTAAAEGRSLLNILALMAGAGLCVFALIRYNTRTAHSQEIRYRAALLAEPQERTVEVYDDRIEVIFPYGTSVYPFCCVEQMLCTGSILILSVPGGDLVIRAEDLTPFDAQTLFVFLNRVIPANKVRCKAPLMGYLQQPHPLSPPPEKPSAAIFTATTWNRPAPKNGWGTAWLWIPGISLLATSVLSHQISLFGELAADFWLLLAMALIGVGSVWGLLMATGGRQPKQQLFVALLENGLVVVDRGITRFYRKEHISVHKKAKGVAVTFPGEELLIDWKDIRSAPIQSEQ